MKVILIIQARVNSKRLYGKSIIPIYKKKSSLQLIIEKFKKIKEIDDIYIATGPKFKNAAIYNQTKKYKVNIFFGSENNVRERFALILKKKKVDFVIRATADNPLVDINLYKELFNFIKKKKCSYVKFNDNSIPTGSGVEIFRYNFFFKHLNTNNTKSAKEHVTLHMLNKKGSMIINPKNQSPFNIRLTIDTHEDFNFVKYIYQNIKKPNIFKIFKFFDRLIN